jgi:hypothetical protein
MAVATATTMASIDLIVGPVTVRLDSATPAARVGRAGGARVKRALGVQALLEWAFRVERAQLELPQRRDIDGEGFGFGMEYVLIQRAIGLQGGRWRS